MMKDHKVGGRGEARKGWARRRVLALGLGGGAALATAGIAGIELVSHGILPGRTVLDQFDGACSVPSPPVEYGPPGLSVSGSFRSAARGRRVGYTLAYPPGRRAGDKLPLVIMLHGYGGNHTNALVGMSPAQA